MDQFQANNIKEEFYSITNIRISANYMEKGTKHCPRALSDEQRGVYVFLRNAICFKVDKAGPKSKARWNSHHYNLGKATQSTLPKSIIKYQNDILTLFPKNKRIEIENLNNLNISAWIKNNFSRIEFILDYTEKNIMPKNILDLFFSKLHESYQLLQKHKSLM